MDDPILAITERWSVGETDYAHRDITTLLAEINRLRGALADSDAELKVQARLAIQRRRALEQIRDYHVIQGMSPALFAEKVLGSPVSAQPESEK